MSFLCSSGDHSSSDDGISVTSHQPSSSEPNHSSVEALTRTVLMNSMAFIALVKGPAQALDEPLRTQTLTGVREAATASIGLKTSLANFKATIQDLAFSDGSVGDSNFDTARADPNSPAAAAARDAAGVLLVSVRRVLSGAELGSRMLEQPPASLTHAVERQIREKSDALVQSLAALVRLLDSFMRVRRLTIRPSPPASTSGSATAPLSLRGSADSDAPDFQGMSNGALSSADQEALQTLVAKSKKKGWSNSLFRNKKNKKDKATYTASASEASGSNNLNSPIATKENKVKRGKYSSISRGMSGLLSRGRESSSAPKLDAQTVEAIADPTSSGDAYESFSSVLDRQRLSEHKRESVSEDVPSPSSGMASAVSDISTDGSTEQLPVRRSSEQSVFGAVSALPTTSPASNRSDDQPTVYRPNSEALRGEPRPDLGETSSPVVGGSTTYAVIPRNLPNQEVDSPALVESKEDLAPDKSPAVIGGSATYAAIPRNAPVPVVVNSATLVETKEDLGPDKESAPVVGGSATYAVIPRNTPVPVVVPHLDAAQPGNSESGTGPSDAKLLASTDIVEQQAIASLSSAASRGPAPHPLRRCNPASQSRPSTRQPVRGGETTYLRFPRSNPIAADDTAMTKQSPPDVAVGGQNTYIQIPRQRPLLPGRSPQIDASPSLYSVIPKDAAGAVRAPSARAARSPGLVRRPPAPKGPAPKYAARPVAPTVVSAPAVQTVDSVSKQGDAGGGSFQPAVGPTVDSAPKQVDVDRGSSDSNMLSSRARTEPDTGSPCLGDSETGKIADNSTSVLLPTLRPATVHDSNSVGGNKLRTVATLGPSISAPGPSRRNLPQYDELPSPSALKAQMLAVAGGQTGASSKTSSNPLPPPMVGRAMQFEKSPANSPAGVPGRSLAYNTMPHVPGADIRQPSPPVARTVLTSSYNAMPTTQEIDAARRRAQPGILDADVYSSKQ